MPNRVKISTKTTRNKKFNSYQTGTGTVNDPFVINTVTSTVATKNSPNIKLLDVNEEILQKAEAIATDSANNTTLIEMSLQVNHETALRLYDYSLGHIPDPVKQKKLYKEYLYYKYVLEINDLSYDSIKSWIATYNDGDSMNKEADTPITFDKNATYKIYGAPEQQILNNRQHYNNCGIESTLNNLIMAGRIKMKENLKDQEKVEKSFLKAVWTRNLAGDDNVVGTLDKGDGGTRPDDYRDIMNYYGINSKSYYITTKSDAFVYPKAQIKELAYKISQGYGAIIGVSSDMLWKNAQSESGGKGYKIDHAIAIIGVVYEDGVVPSETADPVGFFIHDTGGWMTKFISYDEFIDATLCDYVGVEGNPKYLSCLKEYDSRLDTYIRKEEAGIFVTLTDEPIKIDTFNLNVTGDKYANILWGNNSDNKVKGMSGNDTLYGRGGNDKIYGGKGNDVIIGNEALDIVTKYMEGEDENTFEFNTVTDFKKYLDLVGVDIGTRLDNLDYKEIKPTVTFDSLIDMYKYLQTNAPEGINTLDGGAGNDIIIGGEQADLIYGGKGKDYIYGGDGRNAVYGGDGNDVIIGGYDNDRLFGDAGNDIIYGLDDEDVINGGAGNDHLWGGKGSDMIETGKGYDKVYFEGTEFGQDQVVSKSGSTILKFVADGDTAASKVSDFFFSLEVDQQKGKTSHLNVQYKQGAINDDESKVAFTDFYTIKSGKTKTLYLDSDTDGFYTVSASKKAKATVANTKDTGRTKIYGQYYDNSKINNVLLSAYNGAKIKTSTKNDIVTMINNGSTNISTKYDTITYTGGSDKYVSEDRNTYYNAGLIDESTNLSIYDNVLALTKDTDPNYVSKDDRLYLGSAKSDVKYLFDVGLSGTSPITTQNTGVYLLNTEADYTDIVNGAADGGFIYMDSFLKYDELSDTQIIGSDFYGNGQIEGIYYNSETADNYTTFDLTEIAANVAGWLESNTYGYTSAFQAFTNAEHDCADISGLIAAYATPNPPVV